MYYRTGIWFGGGKRRWRDNKQLIEKMLPAGLRFYAFWVEWYALSTIKEINWASESSDYMALHKLFYLLTYIDRCFHVTISVYIAAVLIHLSLFSPGRMVQIYSSCGGPVERWFTTTNVPLLILMIAFLKVSK